MSERSLHRASLGPFALRAAGAVLGLPYQAHLLELPPKILDTRRDLPRGLDRVVATAMAKSKDDWARERIGDGLSIDDLCRHAAMSPRRLTRRFRAATGLPPGEWLQRERLHLAQRLFEPA
jgi:AraC-like DNA-binding protein